jgi:WS/DGAT/MGAT family acyltransferase
MQANGGEALGAVDTAWLRMDRPANLMMVCGLMRLEGQVGLQELKDVVRSRLLSFHRLRQRVADRDGSPRWEFDPWFDLDWHVQRLDLAASSLEQAMGELASTPLDPGKPLWQLHLADTGGASAVVLRIHHCYADGFALLYLVDSITDLEPDAPRAPRQDLVPPPEPYPAWERVLGPLAQTAGDALRGAVGLAQTGAGLLLHPQRALDYALSGADLLVQAGTIAAMGPDSPTRLKGELGIDKRAAWARQLPLAEVKAVAAALCCSVNDVLASCVAGALRGYLLDRGDAVDQAEIRALVPVNLRPPGPPVELGNRFGLVFLSLPVGIDDPVRRTLEVHERMDALKRSHQPLVALGMLAALGVAPAMLRERVLDVLAANASLVLTNVHGQDTPRYLAGRRIVQQMFWVPQAGGIGMGASVFSYDGQVSLGLVTDAMRVRDPGAIARRFAEQFEALLLSTLMMPWPPKAMSQHRRSPR